MSGQDTAAEPVVIVEVKGEAGILTLNRPKALNALTLEMTDLLLPQLRAWAKDPAITRVILKGAGEKAFCAGGDVRFIYDEGRAGRAQNGLDFFAAEYVCDHYIGTYPKPFVSFIDGIAMGGGNGLSMHGAYRIAGDRYLFAMPEVFIGLFPDVGASHALPRLPGFFGTYLALTGGRIRGPEAYACGLVNYVVPTADLPKLEEELAAGGDVAACIAAHHVTPGPSAFAGREGLIADIFSKPSVKEIVAALEAAAAGDGADATFAAETLAAIRKGSPTSTAIALEHMRRGIHLDLADCLRTDLRICHRVVEGTDFYEGVRAVLIDRDNAPKWDPASIDAIDPAAIAAHFEPIAKELQLLAPGG